MDDQADIWPVRSAGAHPINLLCASARRGQASCIGFRCSERQGVCIMAKEDTRSPRFPASSHGDPLTGPRSTLPCRNLSTCQSGRPVYARSGLPPPGGVDAASALDVGMRSHPAGETPREIWDGPLTGKSSLMVRKTFHDLGWFSGPWTTKSSALIHPNHPMGQVNRGHRLASFGRRHG